MAKAKTKSKVKVEHSGGRGISQDYGVETSSISKAIETLNPGYLEIENFTEGVLKFLARPRYASLECKQEIIVQIQKIKQDIKASRP